MDIQDLKVDTNVLFDKSAELIQYKNALQNITGEIANQVQSLQSIWQSSAAEAYQRKFQEVAPNVERILGVVQEYASDLQDIAMCFMENENAALDNTESISIDEIF